MKVVKPSDRFGPLRRIRELKDCPLRELARAYHVDVFVGSWPKIVSYKGGYQEGNWYFGGAGGGYNAALRQMYVAKDHDYTGEYEAADHHEFSHLICAIPFVEHWKFPEETMLLQWEETLVERFGFDREKYLSYLGTTKITSEGLQHWRDLKDPYGSKWWKSGIKRAARVGLIDDNGESTMEWPDWSKLSQRDRQMLENWTALGHL